MGYYTKHIFKITGEHTANDLQRLADAIKNTTDFFTFCAYPEIDCVDDRTWNSRMGAKWYEFGGDIYDIAKAFDMPFVVYTHGEDGEERKYTCSDGNVTKEDLTHSDAETHQNVPNDENREPVDFLLTKEGKEPKPFAVCA